jgi:hypothetical protein
MLKLFQFEQIGEEKWNLYPAHPPHRDHQPQSQMLMSVYGRLPLSFSGGRQLSAVSFHSPILQRCIPTTPCFGICFPKPTVSSQLASRLQNEGVFAIGHLSPPVGGEPQLLEVVGEQLIDELFPMLLVHLAVVGEPLLDPGSHFSG